MADPVKDFLARDENTLSELERGVVTVMPHPNSKVWYDKDKGQAMRDRFLWSSPYDARFPQIRIQRKCFLYYVDYFRCKELMGEEYKPCKFFYKVYKDTCPSFWIKKWDELRNDGRFPAKFDR